MSVRLDDLRVRLGNHELLKGIDLELRPGRIVCVVGPNGAGKTMLLDAICDLVPSDGTVTSLGDTGAREPLAAKSIGRAFQGSPLPATLTVAEVALVATGSKEAAGALVERFGLGPHASSFVSELSTGMRRILDLAVATAKQPAVLLLDEPSSGLAASEIEHLATLIRRWRDGSRCAILVVEHDAGLVRAIADEIVVLDDGRIVGRGEPEKMLDARRTGRVRLRRPEDPGFREALGTVAAQASPAPPLPRRVLSTWTLARLGLREFAAGLSSVLIFGVLNRVLKVELGVSLAVLAPILASLNLAAPLAIGVGHRSDTRLWFGYRRTPLIIGGALLSGGAVAAAPHVAGVLADGISPASVLASVALFAVMGFGMYGAGTVFFALITDLAPEEERGRAASIVYLMLMAGILAGVGLTGAILRPDASNLGTLFAIAGILVPLLTTLGVWGHERRVAEAPQPATAAEPAALGTTLRDIASMSQVRLFFGFITLATIFLFLQQAVLEPYGGEVLGMDVRATSAFNAMLTVGVVAGMSMAGRPWAEQRGPIRMARAGLLASGCSFALLGLAALAAATPPSWLTIFAVGVGNGIFSVAALTLMMGMASHAHTGLFMGAWTVAHALAEGVATGGGGVLYELLHDLTGGAASGYATVFFLQGAGLLASIPLLRRIDLDRFHAEADALETRRV